MTPYFWLLLIALTPAVWALADIAWDAFDAAMQRRIDRAVDDTVRAGRVPHE